MADAADTFGSGSIEGLVLRALVRRLAAKGILSEADIRRLLLDAALSLSVDGSTLTAGAANDLVEEQLAPAFLGR